MCGNYVRVSRGIFSATRCVLTGVVGTFDVFSGPLLFFGANYLAVALDTCLVFQKICTLRQGENDQSGQNVLTVDQWRYINIQFTVYLTQMLQIWVKICLFD